MISPLSPRPLDKNLKCPDCGDNMIHTSSINILSGGRVLFGWYCQKCNEEKQERLDDLNGEMKWI